MESRQGYQRKGAGKACISCRRRKVKCEMSSKALKCRACERRRSECVLVNSGSQISDKHGIINPSPAFEQSLFPANRFGSLIEPLDTCLFQSLPIYPDLIGFPFQDGGGYGPISYDPLSVLDTTSEVSNQDHMLFSSPCFMIPRPLVDTPETLADSGSSSFSILSSEGLHWLYEKSRHGSVDLEGFDSPLHPQNKFIDDDPLADGRLNEPFIALPPKYLALQLFNTYFREINPFCPFFDEDEFVSRVEREYPIYPQSSPSWWACINATIALSCAVEPGFHSKAWFYWKNATLSLNNFFIGRPQLPSAQALIAMTAYLIGTFSATPSHTFVSLAMRILHGLNPAECERSPVYRRVLAITYDLDIDISLSSAMPPLQPIPNASLKQLFDDRIKNTNSPSSKHNFASSYIFDLFDSYCELTNLKSHVYRELYSTTAGDRTDAEIITIVGQLDTLLQDWRDGIPHDYRPELAKPDELVRKDPHLSILYMHFSYYACVLAIHRRAISRATWSMDLDPRSIRPLSLRSPNSRTLISAQLCMRAARELMELIRYIPRDHTLFAGSIAYCTMFAFMILSMLIVQDPQVAKGSTDIKLMLTVENYFSEISMIQSDGNITNFVQCCARYRSIAEAAIKQSQEGVLEK